MLWSLKAPVVRGWGGWLLSRRQRVAMGAGTVYDALEEILVPQSFVVDRMTLYQDSKRDTDVKNRLLDPVGRRRGWDDLRQ